MNKWLCKVAFILIVFISCSESGNDEASAVDAEKLALVKNLKERVAANPDSASTRMRLVNALDSLGMYKEAIAQVDSMILRDSSNSGLWMAKAQLYESNKDTSLAITHYQKAIAIYPSIDAQLSLANLLAEKRDERALAICQAVAQMRLGREMDANTDFIAGIYYARVGDHQKALSLFDRSITNNYTLMEAYMEKGFIYYDTKKYADALKVFEKAITVQNTYADAYYWQAKCYEAMGNKQEAITNYQRSLGLDQSLKEARAALERLE